MSRIEVSQEDYEFLKELQHELNTQETDCQADPIYWSVMEKREVLALDGEGEPRIPYDDGAYSLEELIEDINDNIEDYDQAVQDEWKECDKTEAYDVAYFAAERLGFNVYYKSIYYVEDEDYISRFSGAFLTKRACQQHIKNNKHHYREPHTYAMTAYRNYELERLLKILKTMTF